MAKGKGDAGGGGGNSKKDAGNAKKQAASSAKEEKELAKKAAVEDAEWSKGAKGPSAKKAQEEDKKAEQARKKAEKEALEAAEEAELNKMKKPAASARGADKKAAQTSARINQFSDASVPVESFSARGLDAALEMLEVVESGSAAKASDKLDRHPERRMKSAWLAFQEREMAILKEENSKLRLSQMNELLQKKWAKSPENPLNQEHISHNTSRTEERDMIERRKQEKLESFQRD